MDLDSGVNELPLVGPVYKARLEKLDIKTVENLLHHVPHRYLDLSVVSPITKARAGEILTVRGEVAEIKNQYTRIGKKIQIANVLDNSGEMKAVWFNQPYLVRTILPGQKISLAGKVDWFGREKAFISPEWEILSKGGQPLHTGGLIPVYPETAGISSRWLRRIIFTAFTRISSKIKEFLPERVIKNLELISYPKAIEYIHFPASLLNAENGKKRLSFNELLFLQLKSQKRRLQWKKSKSLYKLHINEGAINKMVESFPFSLTKSQKTAVSEILADLNKDIPMNRLLQGDVGSGKTAVATIAAFTSFINGFQTAIMAPTQILAQQHFDTINKLLAAFKVRTALVTSESKKFDLGRTDIFIGTHALLNQKVLFDKVAFVVIDEQHRFGVSQRANLVKKVGTKKFSPHVLTMTATPIPRTIALSLYGDLDFSTLSELPPGRVPITTWVVPPQKREGAYKWIKSQAANNKVQVFVICPLIEESDKETMQQVKAAKKEYENLKKIFGDRSVGLLHGKQKVEEKTKVLDGFRRNKIDILVATPVVEVGIDVPNATIMVIEGAERYGLAQLHQLRGRVGRGKAKSYCLLLTESKSKKAAERLFALQKSLSGFELAELDLRLRGPGEIYGTRQHGFPELKIASWNEFGLIKSAKKIAEEAFAHPKEFVSLFNKLKSLQKTAN